MVPFLGLWYLAYRFLDVSYWLTLATGVLAAGFLVRIFIIFHDCGHGSFFRARWANDVVGYVTGILTLTPYHDWRHEHALHHATAGDLDRRGRGDVWTLTVREYREASRWKRFGYRLYRNPLVLFGVGPLFVFLFRQRVPRPGSGLRERLSVHLTNLALALILLLAAVTVGLKAVLLVHLPIMAVAGAAGVWLFYVQHQYENVYWERGGQRDYVAAALQGSSLYQLPRVLQWFTGNIGFHHIHHLSPRIPNYRLERCHKEQPVFQQVNRITLLSSLRSLGLRLYDEQARRLVSFRWAARPSRP
ncbi:MAG: fatty acid desaturase [Acidobacteria bacterium]|nr:fatty acid desaturase [Acidobacteriota bacterium]